MYACPWAVNITRKRMGKPNSLRTKEKCQHKSIRAVRPDGGSPRLAGRATRRLDRALSCSSLLLFEAPNSLTFKNMCFIYYILWTYFQATTPAQKMDISSGLLVAAILVLCAWRMHVTTTEAEVRQRMAVLMSNRLGQSVTLTM